MTDREEYIQGPPRDYRPHEGERPKPPEHYRNAAERGRAECLAALAESIGLRKQDDGTWTRDTDTPTPKEKTDG
jgi:hypothetical protein